MKALSTVLRHSLILCFSILLPVFPALAIQPANVTLQSPQAAPQHSLELSWSASSDAQFAEYRLYRSTSSGVDTLDALAGTIGTIGTTSFVDDTLVIKKTYYYRVYVVNDSGQVSSGSNEVSATTTGNSYPMFDDMEHGLVNWTSAGGTWAISDDDAHSGTHNLSDSPYNPYVLNTEYSIVTVISLTGTEVRMPELSFWHKHNFQSSYDHGMVEISTNGGSSYFQAYMTTGYTSSNWVYDSIDLTSYIGQEIYIRFRVHADASTQSDGWHIDDVRIEETGKSQIIPFPFEENFSDTARVDSLWITSTWGYGSGIGYMHSRPDGNSWNNSSYPIYTWLNTSENIDLTNAVSPILTFDERRYDRYNLFRVQVSLDNGATYQTVATYDGNVDSWTHRQINLASYAGKEIRLRFYVDAQYWDGYWLIDNVRLVEKPQDVSITTNLNVGRHGAQIGWSQNTDGDFDRYEFYRSTSSSISRNGNPYVTITEQSTTSILDSLLTNQNTTYYYRIFVVDTVGDVSYGSNTVSVRTPTFPEPAGYPYFDDMESGADNYSEDQPWLITTEDAYSGTHSWSDSPGNPYDANNSKSFYFPLSLGGGGVVRPILTFMHKYSFQQHYDQGLLEISTNGGSNFSIIYSTTGFSSDWEKVELDLTTYRGQNIILRFRSLSDASTQSDGWYIDDIRVNEAPFTPDLTLPFHEDFEDSTLSDSLWIRSTWGLAQSSYNGSQYMHSRPSGNWYNNSGYATTSWMTTTGQIDLAGSTNPILTFYHARYDRNDQFHVQVSKDNGATYVTVASYDGTAGWAKSQVNLSSFSDSKIRIRFLVNWQHWDAYWLIDDIRINEEPEDVVLEQEGEVGRHDVHLSWTQNGDGDFHRYELYRSTSSGVSRSNTLMATYYNREQTMFTDEELINPNRWYYYRVFVIDTLSDVSYGSNEVSVKTPGLPTANSYPFFDDMEHGADHFAEDLPWKITSESAHSGSKSWSDSPEMPYSENASHSMYLPVSLAGESVTMPKLSFWHRYNFQTHYDQGLLEISTNGGSNYSIIFSTTGFSSSNWVMDEVDLTPYLGQDVILRFRVISDASTQSDGWYIDDIRISEAASDELLPYPFSDDFNDQNHSKTIWVSSTWGSANSGHDGTPYWHSRPRGNYYNNSGYATTTWLITASNIDLRNAVNPKLTYWEAHYDRNDRFFVQVSRDNGVSWESIQIFDGSMTTWNKQTLSLASYAGDIIRLRFLVYWQHWDAYWIVDDVSIQEDYTGIAAADFVQTVGPALASTTQGNAITVKGLVYENGLTNGVGQAAGIMAQAGFGPYESLPGDDWQWFPATYDGSAWSDSADAYRASLPGNELGQYHYAFRFSLDDGAHWIISDLDGNDAGSGGDNFYSPAMAGVYLVTEEPTLVLRDTSVVMSLPAGESGTRSLPVFNDGDGPLGFSLEESVDWLAVNPSLLLVDPGELGFVQLLFDATTLDEDSTYTTKLAWSTNDPKAPGDSINVSLSVLDSNAVVMRGFVKDIGTGEGVPWARLGLIQAETLAVEVTAGGDGYFSLYGYDPGSYGVVASAQNYYPAKTELTAPSENALVKMSQAHMSIPTSQSVAIYGTASTMNGDPLKPGDIVTVRDPDGVVAGMFQVHTEGEYGFLHVYADDASTPDVDEGAEPGDLLRFYVNDFPATLADFASITWTSDGDVLNAEFDAVSEDAIILNQEWNLVSFTSVPGNDSVMAVLGGVSASLERVNGFDMSWNDGGPPGARTFDPALPQFSDLQTLSPMRGYWIKVTGEDTVEVTGEKVYDDNWLQLESGWNLISYLPEGRMSLEAALSSLGTEYSVVAGFDQGALTWLRGRTVNDLTELRNGFGYWIRMDEEAALNFRHGQSGMTTRMSAEPLIAASSISPETEKMSPTPIWRDYYGEVDLPNGSIIEAYDSDDVLCGFAVVQRANQYGFMHVYGDDANTPEDEGARAGDVIRFVCNGEIIATTDGSTNWQPFRDAVLLNLNGITGVSDPQSDLPTTFALSPIFPNPFNSTAVISYQLPKAGAVKIEIFNIMGQRVRTLVQREEQSGYRAITWNARNDHGASVSSGVYFVRLVVRSNGGVQLFEEVRKTLLME